MPRLMYLKIKLKLVVLWNNLNVKEFRMHEETRSICSIWQDFLPTIYEKRIQHAGFTRKNPAIPFIALPSTSRLEWIKPGSRIIIVTYLSTTDTPRASETDVMQNLQMLSCKIFDTRYFFYVLFYIEINYWDFYHDAFKVSSIFICFVAK